MYLVENDHPAIITREQYDAAQAMLDKVSKKGSHKDVSPFCGKVICADCGSVFSPKTWHSTDKYRRTVWQCLNKYHNESICTTTHLSEEELQDICMKAANKLFSQADDVRKKVEGVVFKVLDISALEKQRLELAARQEATISEIKNSMTGGIHDSAEAKTSNDLMESLKDIQKEMSGVVAEINDKKVRKASIKAFIDELSKEEPVTRFDAQVHDSGRPYHGAFQDQRQCHIQGWDGNLVSVFWLSQRQIGSCLSVDKQPINKAKQFYTKFFLLLHRHYP